MPSEWNRFLEQAGARFIDGRLADFGPREARLALNGNLMTDLSHQGLIRVSGSEAAGFLAGQFTSDVRKVSDDLSQLSAWCTPKGRMLVLFRLFQREGSYYLLLPMELLEPTAKRLRMYVLRSDVTVGDASGELVRVGVSGPEIPERLAASLGDFVLEPNQSLRRHCYTLVRVPGAHPRYLVISEADAAQALWRTLQPDVTAVGPRVWTLLDIMAGLPTVVAATAEAFLPQMLNLEALAGLSFTKGCFPGQEVIARLRYRGQLKRRMVLANANTDRVPQAGDKLFGPGSESATSVGAVVCAEAHPDGGTMFLAVLEMTPADEPQIRLFGSDGPAIEILPLPYPLPEA